MHKLISQNFDSNVPVEQNVMGSVDKRHATSPDAFNNLVTAAQFVTDHLSHSFVSGTAASP
ncbi:hypothetical protein D3C73_624560 [compost metagenome]